MKIIQQDMTLLTRGILFHQVNCQGIMGGGIAAAFADKWPLLEKRYRQFIRESLKDMGHSFYEDDPEPTHWMLGQVFLFEVVPQELYVANVFGQDRVSSRERMTSYDATVRAFERILNANAKDNGVVFSGGIVAPRLEIVAQSKLPLYMPFKMGCGLGGGDWGVYSAIINRYFPDAIICQHIA